MLLLRYLVWGLARCVLALRYRLHVDVLEQAQGLKGPVLILPNHPAYIDPALVLAALWPALKPRPMRKIDKIPVLGTGKTDYKVLRALIEK